MQQQWSIMVENETIFYKNALNSLTVGPDTMKFL